MSKNYFQNILNRGSGMITCGEGLGVFVGSEKNIDGCPAGWVFVDIAIATIELLGEAITHAELGRRAWPGKEPKIV